MSVDLDLPNSSNGSLLIVSVIGIGLSTHYNEPFLFRFFFALFFVSGAIWLFFLTLTIMRNLDAIKSEYGTLGIKELRDLFAVVLIIVAILIVISQLFLLGLTVIL